MVKSALAAPAPATLAAIELVGGRLCLDFANTLDPRHGQHPHEYLSGYADLVAWSRRVAVLTERTMTRLLDAVVQHPAESATTFIRARELRETIYRIFSAQAQDIDPEAGDLNRVRNAHIDALTHARIIRSRGGFAWIWEVDQEALDQMLWPVARSAVDLLAAETVRRVKECPGSTGCGRLFLDTSKNGSRRWCRMEGCGSRTKMRRHYARSRALEGAPEA